MQQIQSDTWRRAGFDVRTVVMASSRFTNPETRAYGSDGLPEVVLYQVAFELEPARTYVDVFEHWLEEAR